MIFGITVFCYSKDGNAFNHSYWILRKRTESVNTKTYFVKEKISMKFSRKRLNQGEQTENYGGWRLISDAKSKNSKFHLEL